MNVVLAQTGGPDGKEKLESSMNARCGRTS
jgi:hypothetical protein